MCSVIVDVEQTTVTSCLFLRIGISRSSLTNEQTCACGRLLGVFHWNYCFGVSLGQLNGSNQQVKNQRTRCKFYCEITVRVHTHSVTGPLVSVLSSFVQMIVWIKYTIALFSFSVFSAFKLCLYSYISIAVHPVPWCSSVNLGNKEFVFVFVKKCVHCQVEATLVKIIATLRWASCWPCPAQGCDYCNYRVGQP